MVVIFLYKKVYENLFNCFLEAINLNECKFFKKLSQHQRENQGKNNNDTLDLLLPMHTFIILKFEFKKP